MKTQGLKSMELNIGINTEDKEEAGEPSQRGIPRHAGPGDAAANDHHVERGLCGFP